MNKSITPVSPDEIFANRFKDKVLIVTGAAIGSIGGTTAIRAAKEGAKVVCVDLKKKEVNDTVDEITKNGGDAIALIEDIRFPDSSEKMVSETVAKYGKLDLVLNAAGVMDGTDPTKPPNFDHSLLQIAAPIHMASDEYWNTVISTNISGMFFCLRAELRQLVKQNHGGAIVNVGSFAGLTGFEGNPAYTASKHAVTGLTRNAAIDYAGFGIRVNSVNMAQTDTPMFSRLMEFAKWAESKGLTKDMVNLKSGSLLSLNDPNHRGATPSEQAAVILFLLSDDASNITGASYATDGGWTTY